MPAVVYPCILASTKPRFAPRAHLARKVHVVNFYRARIAADAYLMEWKDKAIVSSFREAGEPQTKASAHATREGYQAARACRSLALRHDHFTSSDVAFNPSQL
jgi:hypothetical protein